MKKVLIFIVCLLVFTSVSFSNVLASGGVTLKIDGEKIDYNPAPFIDSKTNRTLVPLRLIAEKMGAKVEWDGEFKLVTIDLKRTTITIKIGNTFAYVNSTEISIDQPAIIVKDRTFMPLRFVSEALGAIVDWNESAKTINIATGKIPPGTFIEPKIEIEYSFGEYDVDHFRVLLKNYIDYPENQFQEQVQIDNYPQLNSFEQPSLTTKDKWDFIRNDGWYDIGENIYQLNKKYYATREDMKNLKLVSGMKIDFTVSIKQLSSGLIKKYKYSATIK